MQPLQAPRRQVSAGRRATQQTARAAPQTRARADAEAGAADRPDRVVLLLAIAPVGAAALQYVRKVAGTGKPSRTNEAAFLRAVNEVAAATARLLDALVTSAPPRDRQAEAAKARERTAKRFAPAAIVHR